MTPRTLTLAALATVAGAAALAWAFAPRPLPVEIVAADRGRFELSIDEDARTRLRERYVVSAPLAGRLSRIALREGDPIEQGAVLALLSPALAPLIDDRSLAGLQARVEAAEAGVLRAAARVDRARVALEQARNEAARTEQLATRGFVAPTKLEADRLAVAAAGKELEAADQDRHVAKHDVDQARAALGTAREGRAARPFEVRAPVAGRVLKVAQSSEATVALGTPLLEIGDTRRLEVVAELLTTDALRTRPGDRVVVERWGGPGTLEGRVRLVEPAAFTKVSALGVEEQRVNVVVDLVGSREEAARLGDGYRVSVRIVVLAVDDAVRVPVGAVFPLPRTPGAPEDATQGWAVFTVADGRARRVPVELGGRNGTHAWIRAGLEPGADVVVYPPPALADDRKVAARRG
jgi:HlyD family secretion protein